LLRFKGSAKGLGDKRRKEKAEGSPATSVSAGSTIPERRTTEDDVEEEHVYISGNVATRDGLLWGCVN